MFELANPWALGLLILPFMVWFLIPRAKVSLPSALKVPFFGAIKHLIDENKTADAPQNHLWLPACIWLCLVIALCGPRWVGAPKPLMREGYNIMMALDLSGSMEIMDMQKNGHPVTRLSVVKEAAEKFVRARTQDKIGLILFGTRAYLQTPLTYDKSNVLMRIEDATAGLAGQTTSIGDALGLAVKHLKNIPKKGRIIILLTDGANNSGVLLPPKAAELAKDENIKVYTIGLGATGDLGDLMVPNASADLDEATLQQIADKTGGRYFRATDIHSLQKIYNTINQLETVQDEQAMMRPEEDYYPWFIALSLALSFYWLASKIKWPLLQTRRKQEVNHHG